MKEKPQWIARWRIPPPITILQTKDSKVAMWTRLKRKTTTITAFTTHQKTTRTKKKQVFRAVKSANRRRRRS